MRISTRLAIAAVIAGMLGCVGNRPALQSNEVLDRKRNTDSAYVKHVLISWRDLESRYSGKMDQRALRRHEGEAKELVKELYAKLQSGVPIEKLMIEHSEDPGSQEGRGYRIELGDSMARMFRALSLRLEVGETGVVLSRFGWHIVKRIK